MQRSVRRRIAASDDKTSSDHFWSSPPLGIDTKAGVARLSWRRSINPTAVTLVFRSLSPIGADGLSLITSGWFHGHPAPAALPKKPIMTNYVRRIPRQQPSPRRAATRRSSVQRPGDAGFSQLGPRASARVARGVAVSMSRSTRSASTEPTSILFWPRCHGTTPNLRRHPTSDLTLTEENSFTAGADRL